MLETTGRAALDRSPGTSDTVIHVTIAADPATPSTGDLVRFYAYDPDGSPMAGGDGSPLCAPCTYDMGTSSHQRISIVQVMVAAGMSVAPPDGGYLVIETEGPDASVMDVTVENDVFLNGGDSTPSLMPMRVPCGGGGGGGQPSGKRIRVVPHALERYGRISDSPNTFDTSVFIAYAGSHSDADPDPAALVDLYLFDESTGAPLAYDSEVDICNPCTFALGGSSNPRRRVVALDDLLFDTPVGTYPDPSADITMVMVETGDVDAVGADCVMARSGAAVGDLSVFVFEPQPIAAAAAVAVRDVARRYADLRNYPDPFNPKTTLSFSLDREEPVNLRIVDLKGRVVRTFDAGRLSAGDHEIAWDGRSDDGEAMPAGVYPARLATSSFSTVEKMVLLK